MRPQLFAAENNLPRNRYVAHLIASMRPQLFAAENDTGVRRLSVLETGFNEAAALRCGKFAKRNPKARCYSRFNEAAALRCGKYKERILSIQKKLEASMRPQLFAAENPAQTSRASSALLLQ